MILNKLPHHVDLEKFRFVKSLG